VQKYTLRLFFENKYGFQEYTIVGFSPTHAMTIGAHEAEHAGASHFNINLGEPDPVEVA
jgi:hypothetical protein